MRPLFLQLASQSFFWSRTVSDEHGRNKRGRFLHFDDAQHLFRSSSSAAKTRCKQFRSYVDILVDVVLCACFMVCECGVPVSESFKGSLCGWAFQPTIHQWNFISEWVFLIEFLWVSNSSWVSEWVVQTLVFWLAAVCACVRLWAWKCSDAFVAWWTLLRRHHHC